MGVTVSRFDSQTSSEDVAAFDSSCSSSSSSSDECGRFRNRRRRVSSTTTDASGGRSRNSSSASSNSSPVSNTNPTTVGNNAAAAAAAELSSAHSSPQNNPPHLEVEGSQKPGKIELYLEKKARQARVVEKIKNCAEYVERYRDEGALNKFASDLSDPELMKKSYLNLDYLESLELFHRIEQQFAASSSQGQDNRIARVSVKFDGAPVSNNNNNNNNSNSNAESADDNDNLLTENNNNNNTQHADDELSQVMEEGVLDVTMNELQAERYNPEQQASNCLKIKLVVSETAENSRVRRDLRALMCPFVSNFSILPKFGMFHTALIIGPWKIEWNNSSLVVPRKAVARASLICADLDAITSTTRVTEVIDKLSEVICDWNSNKYYTDFRSPTAHHSDEVKTTGNCQDFVDDVLAALGIRIKFTDAVDNFIKNLRSNGRGHMVFTMEPEFRDHFKQSVSKMFFHTHKQLDLFTTSLLQEEPDMEKIERYKGDYALLKAFDRAFWMRFYRNSADTRSQPLMVEITVNGEKQVKCPFNDPILTRSAMFLPPPPKK